MKKEINIEDLKIKCPLCHKNNVMVSMFPDSINGIQFECCEDICGCVFMIIFDKFRLNK